MGTDWANLTVECATDAPAVASSRQPDPEERVRRHLEREYGEDAFVLDTPLTVQLSQPVAQDAIDRIFEDCPAAGRVFVVYLSDSTHAGHGELHNRNGLVDEWSGYEGANGADVVGWFREHHSIKGSYATPY